MSSAGGFLCTSTADISSGGTSPQLSSRPGQPAEKDSRPFSVDDPQLRPRTWMPEPSTEKCSGSPRERLRSIVTPTTRCSTSVMDLSGSLPASSATTPSTMSSESCLILCADCIAARCPVTTTDCKWLAPGAAGAETELVGTGVGAEAAPAGAEAAPAG